MHQNVCLFHVIRESFISLQSPKTVNPVNLECKQEQKAKIAVSPRAVSDKHASSRFAFQNNFRSNKAPFVHRTHTALSLCLSSALQSVSLTCTQMEMSHRLTFFPYGFVSPTCQANGKQISLSPTADCSSKRRKKTTTE